MINPYCMMAYILSLLFYVVLSFGSLSYARDVGEHYVNRYARWKSVETLTLPPLPATFIAKRVLLGFIPIANVFIAVWHWRLAMKGLDELQKMLPMPRADLYKLKKEKLKRRW